jgi:hypothetical protein
MVELRIDKEVVTQKRKQIHTYEMLEILSERTMDR